MDCPKTLFLVALAGVLPTLPGCKIDLGFEAIDGADDGYAETDGGLEGGDEPIPDPVSGVPETEWSPMIPGASWSLTWFTSEPIRSVDLGPAGLAIAGASDCALIDPSNGYPIWHAPELDGERDSEVWVGAEGLVWARELDGSVWELRTHALDGALAATAVMPHASDAIAFADAGELYVALDDRVLALDSADLAGDELWSRAASPEHLPLVLGPTADGLLVAEVRSLDEYQLDYRVLELDAAGAEVSATPYTAVLLLPEQLVAADERIYVADGFPFVGARLLALDPGLGVASTLDFDAGASVRIAPAPDGGVLVLVAGQDEPAELVHVDASGEILDRQQASSVDLRFPLLAVGPSGEVIVGGRSSDGTLELHRLE